MDFKSIFSFFTVANNEIERAHASYRDHYAFDIHVDENILGELGDRI